MNNKAKLLLVLEDLFMYYCGNHDIYSACYIDGLINSIYKEDNNNG